MTTVPGPSPAAADSPGLRRLGAAGDLLPAPYAAGSAAELPGIVAPLLLDPEPGRDLVVLLDGVGAQLLEENLALAPTLRSLRGDIRTCRTVAPATTAAAMVSLLTGLSPLEHGVLGYLTLDAVSGAAVNQLTGAVLGTSHRQAPADAVDPRAWLPLQTLGERTARRAIQVAPRKHASSLLTRAAYRGWMFQDAPTRDGRADTAVQALRRAGAGGIVHLHIDDADHAGHRHGVASREWAEALEQVDALLGALLRRVPRGTRVHVTADHGMVDTSAERTIDLTRHPGLLARIATVAGEGRALALRLVPEIRTPEGMRSFAEELQELADQSAVVLTAPEVLAGGIYGPSGAAVPEHVQGRLPDVLVLGRGSSVMVDPRRRSPGSSPEIGVHGSLTAREALVPLLQVEA